MNIIIIGNGFDLAHELPTEYADFLAFCKMLKEVYNIKRNDTPRVIWDDLKIKLRQDINTLRMRQKFDELYSIRRIDDSERLIKTMPPFDELNLMINENVWIGYFLAHPMYEKNNWIDFESEISRVIQSIDKDIIQQNASDDTIVIKITESYFAGFFLDDYDARIQIRDEEFYTSISDKGLSIKEISEKKREYDEKHSVEVKKECITYCNLINRLESDLSKLHRALEIYLSEYVEKIECELISPDINEITVQKGNQSVTLSIVLNFNYTDTFERLYLPQQTGKLVNTYIDYIHGKAKADSTIEKNNFVLGIDEYLSKKRRNKDTRFITFKKYYQRIYKGTGCKYKGWIDKIKADYQEYIKEKTTATDMSERNKKHNLYIFGHSLDVTDADILREFILNDNVYTTIYYHDKQTMGRQIANLVKVIGQDELIKRTGGRTKTIEFKPQKSMKKIK